MNWRQKLEIGHDFVKFPISPANKELGLEHGSHQTASTANHLAVLSIAAFRFGFLLSVVLAF